MKTTVASFSLACLILAGCATVKSGTPLTTGVLLYPTPETLSGSLLFVAPTGIPSTGTSAIVEYRFADSKLREVAAVPGAGRFISSKDGQTLCVLYGWTSRRQQLQFANAVLVSRRTGKSRILDLAQLPDLPMEMAVTVEHVSFKPYPGESVFTFGLEESDAKPILGTIFPGRDDNEMFGFRDADGRYVFFKGGNAPLSGDTLVSSTHDSFASAGGKAEARSETVLNRFPRSREGAYFLCGLSPCRRYALVRFTEGVATDHGPGELRSYYVVNTSTGATWLMLRDTSARTGQGGVSEVYWVENCHR